MAVSNTSSAANVLLAKPLSVVGGVFVAPKGTEAPTDVASELSDSFHTLGYITSDAVTRTVDRSVENIYAWGGYLIAASLNESSCQVSFQCAEYLNEYAQKLLYGDANVVVTPATGDHGKQMAITGKINELPDEVVMVIDVRGSTGAKLRVVYPHFQVTELEDVQLSETEPTVVPITGLAITDGTTGAAFHEYTDDGVVGA